MEMTDTVWVAGCVDDVPWSASQEGGRIAPNMAVFTTREDAEAYCRKFCQENLADIGIKPPYPDDLDELIELVAVGYEPRQGGLYRHFVREVPLNPSVKPTSTMKRAVENAPGEAAA
jgi:hypothetical protein